jgi:RHS repeat-associated protein
LTDRVFTYDGLQRLTSAYNPESGTVSYSSYDKNGNLLIKTDARNVQTTMGYDILDHLTSKAYSPASYGSPVAYTYNTDLPIAGHTEPNYPIGRLVQVSNGNSTTVYRYDAAGRVQSSKQTTAGPDYIFGYTYEPVGLASVTYPSGRTVAYAYDGAGRVDEVKHGTGTDDYASSVLYAAHGAIRQLTLGNSVQETTQFNSRMQAQSLTAGSLLSLTWSHCADGNSADACPGNNGNVFGQAIAAGGKTFTQGYTYDALNRIQQSKEINGGLGWTQNYAPDNYGNVKFDVPIGGGASNWGVGSFQTATNRVTGWGYDASGNITGSLTGAPFATLGYDAESRQTAYQDSMTSAQYSYDGEGRRVQSVVNGATVVYVYDAAGNLAAEYGSSVTSGGRQYLTADYLGSTRLVTDGIGGVVERRDYGPYGEEIPSSGCGQPAGASRSPRCDVAGYVDTAGHAIEVGVRQQFTGKERDGESGLDYFGARYMSSAQGRWTSPDPSPNGIALADPQSWNLYSYVRNRPTQFVDNNGLLPTHLPNLHAEIVHIALDGLLSSGEIAQLVGRQAIMDQDQSPGGSYKHFMHGPNQSAAAAAGEAWDFVTTRILQAQSMMLTSNGQFTSEALASLGDAAHTVEDFASPAHTNGNFEPFLWRGMLQENVRYAAHWWAEEDASQDWARFGLAVRLTMALMVQAAPKEMAERGLTTQNFESQFEQRMSDYVRRMEGFPTSPAKQDADRQCALGNPAACGAFK